MGIGKVDAKLDNLDRKIFRGRRTDLKLIDRNDGNRILGTIRSWNWEYLKNGETSEPTHLFRISIDQTVATRENLEQYHLALNGVVHDVITRNIPSPLEESIQAELRTLPSNERIY